MINYKILVVAGAAILLGGCSFDFNSMLKGSSQSADTPTPSPYTQPQTQATPNPSGGTMGSGSYTMQGTTTLSGDDDTALEKDLDGVNVNSNLDGLVQ